jgi:hypothetical protein
MAQKAQRDTIYIATDSAVAQIKDTDYVIVKGKRYPGNHPVVKHAPALFELSSAFDDDVEQATAAPGERRGG